jgi:hypothetical protein
MKILKSNFFFILLFAACHAPQSSTYFAKLIIPKTKPSIQINIFDTIVNTPGIDKLIGAGKYIGYYYEGKPKKMILIYSFLLKDSRMIHSIILKREK